MKLPAALLALGLLSACTCYRPDSGEVALLHRELVYLGVMAKADGARTPKQVGEIAACVTSAHKHVDSIAGAGS